MKFTAKAIDLDLELQLLNGEVVKIDGPKKINNEQAKKVLKQIEAADKEIIAAPSPITALDVTVKFLMDVYGQDKAFWNDNFDPPLLMSIRKWFVGQLAGIKKKG